MIVFGSLFACTSSCSSSMMLHRSHQQQRHQQRQRWQRQQQQQQHLILQQPHVSLVGSAVSWVSGGIVRGLGDGAGCESDGCGTGVAAVVAAQHLHIRSSNASRFTYHFSRHASHISTVCCRCRGCNVALSYSRCHVLRCLFLTRPIFRTDFLFVRV